MNMQRMISALDRLGSLADEAYVRVTAGWPTPKPRGTVWACDEGHVVEDAHGWDHARGRYLCSHLHDPLTVVSVEGDVEIHGQPCGLPASTMEPA